MQTDLRGLFPAVYRGVLETDILADIGDIQFGKYLGEIEAARRNQFILTADIRGIAAFERIYEIKADASSEGIELRRQRVLAKMLMRIPFTWRFLQQYLERIGSGYSAALYPDKYLVALQATEETGQRHMLTGALRQIIPANMQLNFSVVTPTPIQAAVRPVRARIIRVRPYHLEIIAGAATAAVAVRPVRVRTIKTNPGGEI